MSNPRKGGAGFSRFNIAHKNKGLEMRPFWKESPDASSDEQVTHHNFVISFKKIFCVCAF